MKKLYLIKNSINIKNNNFFYIYIWKHRISCSLKFNSLSLINYETENYSFVNLLKNSKNYQFKIINRNKKDDSLSL